MAVLAESAAAGREAPEAPIWRLTVEQYHRMIDAGIFDEDERVELLEGCLVEKMTKHPPHVLATRRTSLALERLLQPGWFVNRQEPVTTQDSEPEPDLSVVRGDADDYAKRHPGPADVALVVEIAEATVRTDRNLKKRVYARAGIPIYWIVNIPERCLEVYTQPSGPAARPDYGHRQVCRGAENVAVVLGEQQIGVVTPDELLP